MESSSLPEVLAGKYRLLHPLGRGAMGSVWQAHHLTLNSPVAIKLIDPELAKNPEAYPRFMREARAAAALRSPHVVQILDYGVDEGVPYIAMELLEGESLAQRLERVGALSPAETARVLLHIARAATRAHDAGIVHRDLKPENVFITTNDEEDLIKVLDFGIAKAPVEDPDKPSNSGTRAGSLLGTPYYMSPEQAEAARTVDHRTDIWAMGVIAFECLLGRRPFTGEALSTVLLAICSKPMPVPSEWGPVPAGFDEWFAKACARDLSARFSSAKDAAQEFRRLCEPEALDPLTEESSRISLRERPSAADTVVTDELALTERTLFEEEALAAPLRPRRRTVFAGALLGFLLTSGAFVALRVAGGAAGPPEAARPDEAATAERAKSKSGSAPHSSPARGAPETMAARPAEEGVRSSTPIVTVGDPRPSTTLSRTSPEPTPTRSETRKGATRSTGATAPARARRSARETKVDLGF